MAKQGASPDQQDTKKSYTASFKAKGALVALAGEKTLGELSQQFEIHPNQITTWKRQLGERSAEVFGKTSSSEQPVDLKAMYAKIGQLALENDFFRRRAHQGGVAECKTMIDRSHPLPIKRQAEFAGISRDSVYSRPRPLGEVELGLMRRIDQLHLEHPFMGTRILCDQLNRCGFAVGRRHVGTLMKRMGVEALYRKPSTSTRHPGHKVYSYLFRGLAIDRANQVWAMDTTCIPMAKGFVYLTAAIDLASRKVMAAKIAITLES